MARTIKVFSLSLIVSLISLIITIPVMAIPSLPSSFYGTVKINATNVPGDTLVQAVIDGKVYAEGFTQIYQGNSVYVIDIPSEDPDTVEQDGGQDGDTVQFKIGGVMADQTGTWHSGTNVNLDLTASFSGPIITPQVTPTSVPTQTPILLTRPLLTPTILAQISFSATPADTARALLTSTGFVQPLPISTKSSQPKTIPAAIQASLTPIPPVNDINNGSGSLPRFVNVIIILLITIGVVFMFRYFRRK
jgi:hypothetical protein